MVEKGFIWKDYSQSHWSSVLRWRSAVHSIAVCEHSFMRQLLCRMRTKRSEKKSAHVNVIYVHNLLLANVRANALDNRWYCVKFHCFFLVSVKIEMKDFQHHLLTWYIVGISFLQLFYEWQHSIHGQKKHFWCCMRISFLNHRLLWQFSLVDLIQNVSHFVWLFSDDFSYLWAENNWTAVDGIENNT